MMPRYSAVSVLGNNTSSDIWACRIPNRLECKAVSEKTLIAVVSTSRCILSPYRPSATVHGSSVIGPKCGSSSLSPTTVGGQSVASVSAVDGLQFSHFWVRWNGSSGNFQQFHHHSVQWDRHGIDSLLGQCRSSCRAKQPQWLPSSVAARNQAVELNSVSAVSQ